MSTYTDASLIVTPNAKKAGKLYSLKGADLDVVRATTATYVGSDGLIKTALANEPRFDYTNGSCPSILVEPQRTNLLLRSEEFDNATWVKNAINITANSTISPDGTNTADKFIPTSATSLHIAESSLASFVSGTTYTFSFYGKKAENNFIQFTASSALLGIRANFDLNSGVLGTVDSGITATITSIGNDGWYRCTATFTASVTGSYRIVLTAITNSTATRFQPFAGNNVNGLFLWGAQLEAGANATSYIPTVVSTVTRNADVISKTGISSLINSEEGCFYVEANSFINGGLFRQFALSNGTDNSRLTIAWSSIVNTLLIRMDVAGVNVVSNNITPFNQTSNNKILIKWGGGNLKTFVNGVERLSLTSLTMPTANLFTKLGFDRGVSATFFEGNVKSVLVFPTQLTDQQCIALTTL